MSQTTFADGRGIVHQASGGTSLVWPDVCRTPSPGGPAPVPYANLGRAADASKGPLSVRCEGRMVMVRRAEYRRSTGDEAGRLGGVVSQTTRGACAFAVWSATVRFEGRGVCRLGDPLFHNRRNAYG